MGSPERPRNGAAAHTSGPVARTSDATARTEPVPPALAVRSLVRAVARLVRGARPLVRGTGRRVRGTPRRVPAVRSFLSGVRPLVLATPPLVRAVPRLVRALPPLVQAVPPLVRMTRYSSVGNGPFCLPTSCLPTESLVGIQTAQVSGSPARIGRHGLHPGRLAGGGPLRRAWKSTGSIKPRRARLPRPRPPQGSGRRARVGRRQCAHRVCQGGTV